VSLSVYNVIMTKTVRKMQESTQAVRDECRRGK